MRKAQWHLDDDYPEKAPALSGLRVVTLGNRSHLLARQAVNVIRSRPEFEHVAHIDGADEQRAFLRDPNAEPFLAHLAALKPDLLVSGGYDRVLRESALSIPRIGAINVHPALLPRYRGCWPVYWALYEGETVIGATVHEMDLPVDTGAILAQESILLDPDDTPATAYERLAEPCAVVLKTALDDILATGEIRARPQVGSASYRGDPWKELNRLVPQWSLPARELVRRSRAFPGWINIPIGKRRIFFTHIVGAGSTGATPGSIIRHGLRSLDVAAGDGRAVRLYVARPARAWIKRLEASLTRTTSRRYSGARTTIGHR